MNKFVYSDKKKVQTLKTERDKSVFNQDLSDNSNGASLISYCLEFQTEEGRKKWAITKCSFAVIWFIEKTHSVWTAGASVAGLW